MVSILLTVVLPSLILFFFLNLAARELHLKLQEKRRLAEREAALTESLRLDFTLESKTLKRVEVDDPVARILCVDDEAIILDTFRKILVLDGYCVDTVETGQEALGLVQSRHYDFVFTDLKMPAMSGTDVAKAVKHLRPDIDVVIITGFATVETAVECMKHGAMDYVEKPFSEDELRLFTKHAVIKRQDRIQKLMKPRVHVMGSGQLDQGLWREFSLPGGVLISSGHCWVSIAEDGTAKIGLDDFARKLIGRIDKIDFPKTGIMVMSGQPIFTVHQGERQVQFHAPLSGKVVKINEDIQEECARYGKLSQERKSYGSNWMCVIQPDDLEKELPGLKIGNSAVALIQEDIDRFQAFVQKAGDGEDPDPVSLCIGAFEKMDDAAWDTSAREFFGP